MASRRGRRSPSQPRARPATLSSPGMNLTSNPRLTHQRIRPVDDTQPTQSRNHMLVPVYIYPEHLAAVQQFLQALGQPLILTPAAHGNPSPQFKECDDPDFPHSESQGAVGFEEYPDSQYHGELDGFDGGYDAEDLSDNELTSSLSQLSMSSSYISPTASTAGSTHRSRLFATNSSTRASPTPPARYSPMDTLPINTVPSASSWHQASPSKDMKYYSVIAGKKTGVFRDEWRNIQPLVKKVSGSIYKSFPTHEQALRHYMDGKKEGEVKVIRDPGDDAIYGPRSKAMQ